MAIQGERRFGGVLDEQHDGKFTARILLGLVSQQATDRGQCQARASQCHEQAQIG